MQLTQRRAAASRAIDTWSLDEANRLARPSRLKSEVYSGCVAASIVQITPPTTITASSSVTLSATVDGTGPFTYTWSANGQTIPGASQSSYVASPTETTVYTVSVKNACRNTSVSAQVRVEVGSCVAPAIITSGATRNADGTATLTATANGTGPFTFTWKRADGSVLGTGATIQTPFIGQTTQFTLIVTHGCSTQSASRTVDVIVPIVLSTTGLSATRLDATTIRVSWPPASGPTTYIVERRTGGTAWAARAEVAVPSFDDTNLPANTAYAYRVRLVYNTAPTNVDVATTMSYSVVAAGGTVQADHFEELLQALNAVRAAAGWAPVSWPNILAPTAPVPSPGTRVRAEHVLALRLRLNEALQALGVPIAPFTDPSALGLKLIRAQHLTELQERVR